MDINNLLNEDFIDDSLKTNDFYDSENIENIENIEDNETIENIENIEITGNIPESFIKEFLNS